MGRWIVGYYCQAFLKKLPKPTHTRMRCLSSVLFFFFFPFFFSFSSLGQVLDAVIWVVNSSTSGLLTFAKCDPAEAHNGSIWSLDRSNVQSPENRRVAPNFFFHSLKKAQIRHLLCLHMDVDNDNLGVLCVPVYAMVTKTCTYFAGSRWHYIQLLEIGVWVKLCLSDR